jgi:hypothetical protein
LETVASHPLKPSILMLIAVDLVSDIHGMIFLIIEWHGMGIYEKKIVEFILFWYSLI